LEITVYHADIQFVIIIIDVTCITEMYIVTENSYSHLQQLNVVPDSSAFSALDQVDWKQEWPTCRVRRPHSRPSEVGRQGHGVWGLEILAESRGRVFGGLRGGTKAPKCQKWKFWKSVSEWEHFS